MSLNREQGLFVVVLVLAGAWIWLRAQDSFQAVPAPRGPTFEIAAAPAVPAVEFVGAAEARFDALGRDVFAPPRPWNDLPLLALPFPPNPSLGAVGPIPEPGILPESYARFRRPPPAEAIAAAAGTLDPGLNGGAGEGNDPSPAEDDESGDERFGGIDFGKESQPAAAPADEQLERVYDWIQRPNQKKIWGQIRNADKIGLIDKPEQAIEFQQFDPRTGRPLSQGTFARVELEGAGAYLAGFGFADTVKNRAAMLWREVRPAATNVARQIDAGKRCMEWLLEDPAAAREGAEKFARSALGFDPSNADGYALLGQARESAHDLEGELDVYRLAQEAGAEHSRLLTRKGMIQAQLGLRARAEETLRAAVDLDPNDAVAWHELGRVCLQLEKPEPALQAFDEALRGTGLEARRKAEALVDQARAHLMAGRQDEAQRSVDRALHTGAAAPAALNLNGLLALLRGDAAAAREAFAKALGAAPGHRDATLNAGIAAGWDATGTADPDEARERFTEAADLDPLRAFAATAALGALEESTGDDERAALWFDAALEMDPGNPYGLYRGGRNARRLGDLDTARTRLTRALVEYGRITDVLNELGIVALLSDRADEAARYFEESLRREPAHVTVNVLRALSLLRRNAIEEALAAFEESSEANTNAAALCGAAWCLYRLGRVDDALARFADARAAAPSEGDPFWIYADTWQKRVADHESKEQWVDRFDRDQIKNGWDVLEAFGPTVTIADQQVLFEGIQRAGEDGLWTEMRRPVEGATLVLFEADVTLDALSEGSAGIALIYERAKGQGGVLAPHTVIAVELVKDGSVRLQVLDGTNVLQDWQVVDGVKLEPGQPARLTIERTDYEKGLFLIRVDERVVASGIEVPAFRKFKNRAQASVFTRAEGREKVSATCEFARVVRHKE